MKNEEKLKSNIKHLSVNTTDWDATVNEWVYTTIYVQENSECLCGKKNIKNVCVITNKGNNNVAEVGNCCVSKFMYIKEGNEHFNSLKKITKNIKSNISKEFLEHLKSLNFLSDEENRLIDMFIRCIKSPEKKTSEEWDKKVEINKRILEHFVR